MEPHSVQVLEEDELYQQSLAHLQRGEWEHAVEAILNLQQRYGEGSEVDALLEEARFKAALDEKPLSLRRSFWQRQWERWRAVAPWLVLAIVALGMVAVGVLAYQRRIVPARLARQEEIRLAYLRERGQSYLAARQYGLAIEAFQEVLTDVPDDQTALQGIATAEEKEQLETLYNRAAKLLEMDEWEAALHVMDRIQDRKPDYKGLGDMRAVAEMQLSLAATLEEAEAAYRQGDWEQVQLKYEQLRALDRSFETEVVSQRLFETYVRRGQDLAATASETLDPIQDAGELFAKALTLRPGEPQAVAERDWAQAYLVGWHAYADGNWQSVADALGQLHADRPDYAGGRAGPLLYEAYLRNGQAYEAQGDPDSALAVYQDALEVGGVNHSLVEACIAALSPITSTSVEETETGAEASAPTPTPEAPLASSWEYGLSFMGARSNCTHTGVRGLIQDQDGLPIRAIAVGLWNSAGILWTSSPSDADGQYEIIVSSEPIADTWTVSLVDGGQPVSPSYSFRTSLGCVNGLQEYRIDWRRSG